MCPAVMKMTSFFYTIIKNIHVKYKFLTGFLRLIQWELVVFKEKFNEYLIAANEMQWFSSQRSAEMGWNRQHSHNPTQLTVCYLTEQRYSVFTAVAGGMFLEPLPVAQTLNTRPQRECQEVVYRSCVAWIQSFKKFKKEKIACSSLHKLHYIMILFRYDLRKWKRKDTKEWISTEGAWNHFLPDVHGISASGDKALTRMRWNIL